MLAVNGYGKQQNNLNTGNKGYPDKWSSFTYKPSYLNPFYGYPNTLGNMLRALPSNMALLV